MCKFTPIFDGSLTSTYFDTNLQAREPCTQAVQSSRIGCSRQVLRIVYLAVKRVIFWSMFSFQLAINIFRSKILTKLTVRYTILCTRRLQPTRDDCAVQVQWSSSVN